MLCLFAEEFAYGERFSATANRAAHRNPNCTLLDVDDTVHQLKVDWLTGTGKGSDGGVHQE